MSSNVVKMPVREATKPHKAQKGKYVGPLQAKKLEAWAKRPPTSTTKVNDGDRTGFGCQITPKGSISFYIQYHHNGRRKFYNLGKYKAISLAEARQKATEARELVDKGICPREAEKEAQRAQKAADDKEAQEPTIGEALETYIQKHVSGLSRGREVEQAFRNDVIPVIGAKKVKELRRRDVREMVETKAESAPTAARRLLAYTKTFLDWCVDRDDIENSPAAGIKPSSIKVSGKKNALKPHHRERVLDDAEIKELWHTDSGMQRLTHLALKLVLVTGQRPGEVTGMHRDEIQGDVWTIPASRRLKTETAHTVPLCPLAKQIINEAIQESQRLEKRRGISWGYVFEARPASFMKVHTVSQAVRRTLQRDWRPHDLRRTCRTRLAKLTPENVAELVIGHTKKGMISVYDQHKYSDEKREALEAWAEKIKEIVC